MADQEEKPKPWHVEKGIPMAFVLTILTQTIVVGWFLGDLSNRVESAIQSNAQQDARLSAAEQAVNTQAIGAATTSADLKAVREGLVEVKEGQAETNRLLREIYRGSTP